MSQLVTVQVQLCALRAQAEYGDHGHANNFDYKSAPAHTILTPNFKKIKTGYPNISRCASICGQCFIVPVLSQTRG